MPGFDGAGTFVRTYNWTSDASNAIPILASRMDTEDNGFAAGLSNCITRDGQGKPSSDISWNSHKITNLADATADTDAMNRETSDGRYLRGQYKKTTGATARHSTTTLAADPELVFSLPAAGYYSIDGFLTIGNIVLADTNGFKFDFSYSGTTTKIQYAASGYINSAAVSSRATDNSAPLTYASVTPFGITQSDWIHINGFIVVSTTGTLSLRWAQNSSTTTDVAIDQGSWLRVSLIA